MNRQDLLQQPHPFLEGLGEAQLDTLARCAMRTHFPAGTLLFREGDIANRFYLIQGGKISIETHSAGQLCKVQTLTGGDVLGWSWLFPPYGWHFDARAEEDTDAIFLYATPLRQECETDPALGYELMRRVAQILIDRLQATRLELVHSATNKPSLVAGTSTAG